jgi:hypothetical protein
MRLNLSEGGKMPRRRRIYGIGLYSSPTLILVFVYSNGMENIVSLVLLCYDIFG